MCTRGLQWREINYTVLQKSGHQPCAAQQRLRESFEVSNISPASILLAPVSRSRLPTTMLRVLLLQEAVILVGKTLSHYEILAANECQLL